MNKKDIAQKFLTMIIGNQIQEAFDAYTGENFVHHNQYTKPGKEELIKGMQGSEDNFPNKTFTIEMVTAEEDLVMIYSFLKFNADHLGMKVVHIFRFENDMIVEMRDLGQQIEENAVNK